MLHPDSILHLITLVHVHFLGSIPAAPDDADERLHGSVETLNVRGHCRQTEKGRRACHTHDDLGHWFWAKCPDTLWIKNEIIQNSWTWAQFTQINRSGPITTMLIICRRRLQLANPNPFKPSTDLDILQEWPRSSWPARPDVPRSCAGFEWGWRSRGEKCRAAWPRSWRPFGWRSCGSSPPSWGTWHERGCQKLSSPLEWVVRRRPSDDLTKRRTQFVNSNNVITMTTTVVMTVSFSWVFKCNFGTLVTTNKVTN